MYQIIVMVLRTYPIRSCNGPLGQEISWEEVKGKCQPEMSTVTKRIRRIGLFDYDKAKKAVRLCRPDYIALTFVDYINPSDYQITQYEELSDEAKDFVTTIRKYMGPLL